MAATANHGMPKGQRHQYNNEEDAVAVAVMPAPKRDVVAGTIQSPPPQTKNPGVVVVWQYCLWRNRRRSPDPRGDDDDDDDDEAQGGGLLSR